MKKQTRSRKDSGKTQAHTPAKTQKSRSQLQSPVERQPLKKKRNLHEQLDFETDSKKSTVATPHPHFQFPIVGIGSSAGGLSALCQVLSRLPQKTGMAFIILQHLYPTHESQTPEVLSRSTCLPVVEATSGLPVEPDKIYTLPPGVEMTIFHGILHLKARGDLHQTPRVIDRFLCSLAEDRRALAIGVILSGGGSDGTAGLESIKSEGGLTLVQDPKTAEFDNMPKNAIDSGVADLVLTPTQIGEELKRLHDQHYGLNDHHDAEGSLPSQGKLVAEKSNRKDPLAQIFSCLRSQTRVDFSEYKKNTLMRRIAKRMFLCKISSLEDYAKYLQENQNEVKALYADVLITVTSFFRDPEAYQALVKQAFTRLFHNRPKRAPFRVWVPGCATGEEAYSIAISLLEYLGPKAVDYPIQIFGSDISEGALQKARVGVYPEESVKDVPKAILERYFTSDDAGNYRVNKSIRDLCLFSKHDVTIDPPFAKRDLICCRNLLIYFSTSLQSRVLPLFHYALNPGGILWLGSSETVGVVPPLFRPLDKIHKVFIKEEAVSPVKIHFPARPFLARGQDDQQKERQTKAGGIQAPSLPDLHKEFDRVTLNHYSPPAILLNESNEIVQIRGKLYPYLEMATGLASLQVFKMARLEISAELRKLLQKATEGGNPARKENIRFEHEGKLFKVNLEVVPVKPEVRVKGKYYFVYFENAPSAPPQRDLKGPKVRALKKEQEQSVLRERLDLLEQKNSQLEQELAAIRESYQILQEDRATSQEEFTSANEELQSMNEELQSTNEELETAKEELQSTNEELATVNDEFQARNADLGNLTDDLLNFVASAEIPIVMVDSNQCVRRFTPMASRLLNLIQADIGRPMGNIKSNLVLPDLQSLVSDVFQSMTVKEIEIQDTTGHWYRLLIRPYRTSENKFDGAVLAFLDIDALKRAYDQVHTSEAKYRALLESAYDAVVTTDKNGTICVVNKQTEKWFGYDRNELIGQPVEVLVPFASREQHVKERTAYSKNPHPRPMGVGLELHGQRKDGTVFPIDVSLSPVETADGQFVIAMIREISGRKKLEEERNKILKSEREAKELAERGNQAKDIFLATLSHELRTPLTAILSWAQILKSGRIDAAGTAKGLGILEESAIAQNQLINDLLDVSRIIMGKLAIEKRDTNLVSVLKNAIEITRPLAEKKKLSLEIHLESTAAYVLADPARLRQIFWNILTNAIKFTPPGGSVTVSIDVVAQDSGHIATVRIHDTGKGIKPEFMPHLFNRFIQQDSSSIRLHGGLGLGLSIVHSLMGLHGGTVKAESAGEGKGSTFSLSFPLIPAPSLVPLEPGRPEITVPKGLTTGNPLLGLRILIVDDEDKTRETIKVALSLFGATVETAGSAEEGYAAVSENPPDLLVGDIAMPIEDGLSMIRRIRALSPDKGGNVPAIALTAFAGSDNQNQAIAAGFQAHLAKPVDIAVLVNTVLKHTRGQVQASPRAAV